MGNTGGYFLPECWDTPEALSAVLPAVGRHRQRAVAGRRCTRDPRRRSASSRRGPRPHGRGPVRRRPRTACCSRPGRWTLGFMKAAATPRGRRAARRGSCSARTPSATSATAGRSASADPAAGFSFAYVMNQMAPDQGLSATGQSLVDATYRALGYVRRGTGAGCHSDAGDTDQRVRRTRSARARGPRGTERGSRSGADPGEPRRDELRRHPQPQQLVPGGRRAPVRSGRRGRGRARGHRRARGGANGQRRLRRARRGPGVALLDAPGRGGRRNRARARGPGRHRLAPDRHLRARPAGRDGGGARCRRRRRVAGGPARVPRRRSRDRHGLDRGEARGSRWSWAPTPRSIPIPTASPRD